MLVFLCLKLLLSRRVEIGETSLCLVLSQEGRRKSLYSDKAVFHRRLRLSGEQSLIRSSAWTFPPRSLIDILPLLLPAESLFNDYFPTSDSELWRDMRPCALEPGFIPLQWEEPLQVTQRLHSLTNTNLSASRREFFS